MKKVLVFGTFDVFHPGHDFFLRKAKSYGDELYVVVARDSTVNQIKNRIPINNEKNRVEVLNSLSYVNKVRLGYEGDKYKIIEEIKPDVICLGYDQKVFTENLKEKLRERGLNSEIIRINESYKPEMYKSSKIIFEKVNKTM
jgi:FAD synthetase